MILVSGKEQKRFPFLEIWNGENGRDSRLHYGVLRTVGSISALIVFISNSYSDGNSDSILPVNLVHYIMMRPVYKQQSSLTAVKHLLVLKMRLDTRFKLKILYFFNQTECTRKNIAKYVFYRFTHAYIINFCVLPNRRGRKAETHQWENKMLSTGTVFLYHRR